MQRAPVAVNPESSEGWIVLGAAKHALRGKAGRDAYRTKCVELGKGAHVEECRRVALAGSWPTATTAGKRLGRSIGIFAFSLRPNAGEKLLRALMRARRTIFRARATPKMPARHKRVFPAFRSRDGGTSLAN